MVAASRRICCLILQCHLECVFDASFAVDVTATELHEAVGFISLQAYDALFQKVARIFPYRHCILKNVVRLVWCITMSQAAQTKKASMVLSPVHVSGECSLSEFVGGEGPGEYIPKPSLIGQVSPFCCRVNIRFFMRMFWFASAGGLYHSGIHTATILKGRSDSSNRRHHVGNCLDESTAEFIYTYFEWSTCVSRSKRGAKLTGVHCKATMSAALCEPWSTSPLPLHVDVSRPPASSGRRF